MPVPLFNFYTQEYKWKNEASGNYPRNGGRGKIEGNGGGGEFTYDIYHVL
jgi:hypothetical protein